MLNMKILKNKNFSSNRRPKKNTTLDPKISTKIDELLILLTKKIKQEQNNQMFHTSYLESLLKDIHNITKHKKVESKLRGGGNLTSYIAQLFILLMTINTSLSTSLILKPENQIHSRYESNYTNLQTITTIPSYSHFTFSEENVIKYRQSKYIDNSIKSFNKHYVSMFSEGSSQLNTFLELTICAETFFLVTMFKNF
jgi:hypothetical protein